LQNKKDMTIDLKSFLIQKIPSHLFVSLFGRGWRGNFKYWAEALRLTTGYDASIILEKSKNNILDLVKKQKDKYPNIQYPWELLSSLMWVAAQNNGKINIIDFGGALGITYYQYKIFFDQLKIGEVQWNVVEQPHFVELGKKEFENDILKFYISVDDCVSQNTGNIHCVLFSSVLPYLEKPYELLSDVLKKKFKYIIIARTYFTKNKSDRITVQKVPKNYYDASYPCWIFEKNKIMNFLTQYEYELIYEYKEKYQLNIPSESIGCVFKLIENR